MSTATATPAPLLPKAWVNEARVNELTRAAEVLAGVRDDADLPEPLRKACAALGPAMRTVAAHLMQQAIKGAVDALAPAEAPDA